MIRAEFTEQQPQYKYMQLDENNVDVIIYSFIESKTIESYTYSNVEDGSVMAKQTLEPIITQQMMYVYDMNIFRCNPIEITENMVKNDLAYYLTYNSNKKEVFEENQNDINIDVDYRLSMLELGI